MIAIQEVAEVHERGSPTRRKWVTVAVDERGWYVRLAGSAHLARYSNVTQAIHHARRLAHQHKPSSLLIRYSDGAEEASSFESPTEA